MKIYSNRFLTATTYIWNSAIQNLVPGLLYDGVDAETRKYQASFEII